MNTNNYDLQALTALNQLPADNSCHKKDHATIKRTLHSRGFFFHPRMFPKKNATCATNGSRMRDICHGSLFFFVDQGGDIKSGENTFYVFARVL